MTRNKDLPAPVQWERRVSFKKEIPWIRKQRIDFYGKKFVLINEISKISLNERKNYILLFYTRDSDFNAFYKDLTQERLEILQGFYAIVSLDFSTHPDGDQDENFVAIKKNRRFCTFCQQQDILCIYNVVWSSKDDYKLSFSNVEKGAVVALSTYRISDPNDKLFRDGYEPMKRRIRPSVILCYGNLQACMEQDEKSGLVIRIPTRFRIVKQEQFEKAGQYSFIDLLLTA